MLELIQSMRNGGEIAVKDQSTKKNGAKKEEPLPGTKIISRAEGKKIVDKQARKYFGMSGPEFVKKYRAGEMGGYEHSDVAVVAILIPLSE
jgi:hypothetical protein